MSADTEATRMRRYLIGASSEAERAAVEAEYFSREDAIDALAHLGEG